VAMVDSGITLLGHEYHQNNLENNWDVRSYTIHHLADAHLARAQLTDSLEDLRQAFVYANEALARRGKATQGDERASTLALLAECEAYRINHGAEGYDAQVTSTSTLLAAADTIYSRGNVRIATRLKLSAARLILAEGRRFKNSDKLAQAAQISEECQKNAESIELIHIAATAMALRAEVAAAQFEITGEAHHRDDVKQWSTTAAALIPLGQSAPLHASVVRARRVLN
jgi:serine/threonine protein phosphatase PrpC